MAKVTIAFGGLLILLGFAGFALTGGTHFTALIPAIFGVVLESLGILALIKPNLRMHVMHVAVLLALVGVIATVSAIPDAYHWMRVPVVKELPDTSEVMLENGLKLRPAAAVSKSIMALVCAVYMALAIQSFIMARVNRNKSVPPFEAQD